MKSYLQLQLVLCLTLLTGCTVPKEIGPFIAGEETKIQLLQQGIGKVAQALQWKDPVLAAEVVKPTLLPTFIKKALKDPKNVNVFAVSPDDMQFDTPQPGSAEVLFEVQAYGSPTYSVRTFKLKTRWEFSRMDGGWKMASIEDYEATP